MATIKPLKGILYNRLLVRDRAAVTTPPYDVISPEAQNAFYDRHPNNVIRLILNRPEATDGPGDNPHKRSAALFHQWRSTGILQQDRRPALYLEAISFCHQEKIFERYGLIALVGLEPFEKGVVLPHEKTFSKVTSERLALLKETRCHFCSIFALYPDDGTTSQRLANAVNSSSPDDAFIDEQGHRHRLWRIVDSHIHRWMEKAMKDKSLLIADGHHRYETALRYRQHLEATDPDFNERHPANYVLMYLCSMNDPGLIILPAHRLLKAIAPEALKRAIEGARSDFAVTDYPFDDRDRKVVENAFLTELKKGDDRHRIGIYARGRSVFHLLTLKPSTMDRLFRGELDPSLRSLDVTVLTRLVFMRLLGFDQRRLNNEQLIGYASSADQAFSAVDAGDCDAAFLLNPTRIEQVQQVARKGLIMPRKSTYFYPKVRSGLVMNTLEE